MQWAMRSAYFADTIEDFTPKEIKQACAQYRTRFFAEFRKACSLAIGVRARICTGCSENRAPDLTLGENPRAHLKILLTFGCNPLFLFI